MARWNGVCGDKGRWKQNLIAKCLRDGKARADTWICRIYRHSSNAKIRYRYTPPLVGVWW